MIFAVTITYRDDKDFMASLRSIHHDYMFSLLTNGSLQAAGPFAGHTGALWVLQAETPAAAEAMIKADPFYEAGLVSRWHVHPLAYWSAKAHKGA